MKENKSMSYVVEHEIAPYSLRHRELFAIYIFQTFFLFFFFFFCLKMHFVSVRCQFSPVKKKIEPTFDQLVFEYVFVAETPHQTARISQNNKTKKKSKGNYETEKYHWLLTNSYRMFIFSGPIACEECNGWQKMNQMWLALSMCIHGALSKNGQLRKEKKKVKIEKNTRHEMFSAQFSNIFCVCMCVCVSFFS